MEARVKLFTRHVPHPPTSDRVSVVEGVLGDLKHGHVPNVLAERGWKAEWKHNRTGLLRRILVRVVLVSAAVAYFSSRRTDSYQEE